MPSGSGSSVYEIAMSHCLPSPQKLRIRCPEIACCDVDLANSVPAQPFEQKFEDRLGSNRHERLRQNRRIRPQSRSFAARLDYSFHCALRYMRTWRQKMIEDAFVVRNMCATEHLGQTCNTNSWPHEEGVLDLTNYIARSGYHYQLNELDQSNRAAADRTGSTRRGLDPMTEDGDDFMKGRSLPVPAFRSRHATQRRRKARPVRGHVSPQRCKPPTTYGLCRLARW